MFGETPTPGRTNQLSSETPHMNKFGETPTPRRGLKSRWDDKTPLGGTPGAGFGGMTPTPGGMTPSMAGMTPERLRMLRWEKEVQDRNRPLTDDELNQILPSNGYEVKLFTFIKRRNFYL
jgi:splicing factor 3B subunit 1